MPKSVRGGQKNRALLTMLCVTSYDTCTETWELGGGKYSISSKQKVCGSSELGKVDLCAKRINRSCNTE